MMTGAIGRLLRLAAAMAAVGLVAGCASAQGPGVTTAPPGFGKDADSRVERLVQYCDRLFEKGEHLTALGLCARAHEIDPDAQEPLLKLAGILEAMGRTKAAAETYDILLARHPSHHEAQYRLGKLHMEGGETVLAARQFERAIRSDPEDPRPYNALGILRDQAGEHEAAQALYRAALERDANSLSVRNNLGLSLALDGKREEAIEVLAALAVDAHAGETVLRNLEAAYAARAVEPAAAATAEPPAGPDGSPAAADTLAAPAPSDGPGSRPTPLIVPPAAAADAPEQSGALMPQTSVILAAAELLMQPPKQAEVPPDLLMPEIPVPAATTTVPPGDTLDDAEFLNTRLEGGGTASQLALLLTDGGPAIA